MPQQRASSRAQERSASEDPLQARLDRKIINHLQGLFPDRRVVKLFPPNDGFQSHDHEPHGFRVLRTPPVTLLIQYSILRDPTRLAPLLEGRDVTHKIRFVKRGEALFIHDAAGKTMLDLIPF